MRPRPRPPDGRGLTAARLSRRKRIMVGMTDPLPPYTADRPQCSKCGHDTATTNYTLAKALCACQTPTGIGERLCRQCERCGYHWDEALATNDQAALFRDRVPLGQQFTTEITYEPGSFHLVVKHALSGIKGEFVYPSQAGAEAGARPLLMFQALLDQVDEWQRQPIDVARGEAA